ncbi:MAG: pyruvate kinase [Candidatus Bathyarchaeota archaeon B26-2]|nr:MAG: pyruvate kinase [Candidatus Bathyarchaeota archaeon B26-2]
MFTEASSLKKTKIICTIGPASLSKEVLEEMYRAGMNGVRINTAYGDLDQYKTIVDNVRETADIPIIVDIKGPEIRLRAERRVIIQKGEVIEVGFNREEISFNHDFYDEVSVGDDIYIDNGRIRTRILEKVGGTLRLLVMNDGEIDDGKGVNIPNKQLSVPSLSKKDLEIIEFAKEYDVEFIALSFTRNAQDVENLKAEADGYKGGLIAKIENLEGVKNFREILDRVEGIMIARGDLGVEIELERVPLVQKSLIRLCNQRGKTVVTATDMLESMMYSPTPTRAEVSDVANAILDGTDAVMLSGETSIGKYPVKSVSMMSRIAKDVEVAVKSHVEDGRFINISDTVSKAIRNVCQNMPLDKVVTLTRSGYTAKMIARFRIPQPIIAVTPEERVKRQLELVFGVYPVHIDYRNEKDRILAVARMLHSMNLIDEEDTVLFTAAFRTVLKHASNLIEIHTIKELMNLAVR